MNQKRYQVWLGGSELIGHVWAKSETEAMNMARQMIYEDYGVSRVPADTCVCPISNGYYEEIAESNRHAGFNAMTDF